MREAVPGPASPKSTWQQDHVVKQKPAASQEPLDKPPAERLTRYCERVGTGGGQASSRTQDSTGSAKTFIRLGLASKTNGGDGEH